MTTDNRPLPPRTPDYAVEIRHRAENRIEEEIHEHESRRNVNAGYIIAGTAFLAIGTYLLLADPGGLGTRTESDIVIAPAQPQPSQPVSPRRAETPKAATDRQQSFAPELVDDITRTAQASGIQRATIDRALASAGAPSEDVLRFAQEQPELTKSTGDYLAQRVTNERVEAGRRKLTEHAPLLTQLERRYGIDRHVLVAIWGIESNYGAGSGDRPVLRSLLSLVSSDQRRRTYWRDELMSALALIDKGDITERAAGSWAGALGPMQLMPSSVQRYATDFDGDGRRDVIASVPDALATAANQLKASGWTEGRIWGREVKLPPSFDFALASQQTPRSVTAWQQLGVRPATGLIPLDDDPNWYLVLPAGASGPAFLVSSNFTALMKYNRALPYAIAVGHLADRLAGGSALVTPWPTDDVALSMTEAGELQHLLSGLGFDPGPLDGIIGQNTREAVRNYQKARALVPDGHPTIALLRQIRTERRN